MGSFFFMIFVFVGVMAFAALLFGGWVVAGVFRFVANVFLCNNQPRTTMTARHLCFNPMCRAANPPQARFCRRCGRPIPNPQPRAVAAMW